MPLLDSQGNPLPPTKTEDTTPRTIKSRIAAVPHTLRRFAQAVTALWKWFSGLAIAGLLAALATTYMKPDLELYDGEDQDLRSEFTESNVTPDGTTEVIYKLFFRLRNNSIVPGNVETANCYPSTLTNHPVEVKLLQIDRDKLWFHQRAERYLTLQLRVPLSGFAEKRTAVFYCTILDNERQVISEKLNFGISTVIGK